MHEGDGTGRPLTPARARAGQPRRAVRASSSASTMASPSAPLVITTAPCPVSGTARSAKRKPARLPRLIRYLKPVECTRLVNACAEPFRSLVRGVLLAGARYSELARLKAADIDLDARTVAVRETKAGKPRHIVLTDEATALFRSLVHGKEGSALVFPRCLVPECDGVGLSPSERDALWGRFFTGAPRPRTPCEQSYSDRKLRPRNSRGATGSTRKP